MPAITRQELEAYLPREEVLHVDPIPDALNQWGPCCGFYALSIAMKVVAKHDARLETPPARKGDDPTYEGRSLRSYGKHGQFAIADNQWKKGPVGIDTAKPPNDADAFTELGSIYDVAHLVKLARHLNYGAKAFDVKDGKMYRVISKLITANCPAIVPFDVTDQGEPGLFQGDRAHYGLVFGCFTAPSDGKRYYFATHWGKYYYWSAGELQTSCDQLMTDHGGKYIKVYSQRKGDRMRWEWMNTSSFAKLRVKTRLFLTDGERQMNDADLKGLRSKIVGIGLSSTSLLGV
jgi:hypothetical protein